MKQHKKFVTIAIAIVSLGALAVCGTALAWQAGIKRTQLQRHDLSASGREVIQVRVDFATGTAFGNHSHPGEEIIYVIEGVLEYKVQGKPPVTLKAGEVLFVPAGTIHSARNAGSGNAAELATYIVQKGKPLLVMVKIKS